MTLTQSDVAELLDASRAGGDIDVIRKGVESSTPDWSDYAPDLRTEIAGGDALSHGERRGHSDYEGDRMAKIPLSGQASGR